MKGRLATAGAEARIERAAAIRCRALAPVVCAFLLGLPAVAPAQDLPEMVRGCASPDSSPGEALRLCDLALEFAGDRLDRPNRARVAFNAGVAALDLNNLATAKARLDLAIELDPGLAPAYVSRAEIHRRQNDATAALVDYDAAIQADPRGAAPHQGRGQLLADVGRPEEAIASFEAAAALEPAWAAPHLGKGRALFALERYPGAVDAFSAAIARDPRDPTAWLNRGEARMRAAVPGARNDYDRALLLSPEWAAAHYARALFLDEAGETEAANADYMRAHQLGLRTPQLEEKVRELSGG